MFLVIIILVIIVLFIVFRQSNSCCVDMHLCRKINAYLEETQSHPEARYDPSGVLGMAKWNYILSTELYDKMQTGRLSGPNAPVLLDVRRPEDFARGHIPGSINIFWLDLMKENNICHLAKITNDMERPIIVICYVGHTSSQTIVLLRLIGFHAIGLKYGMGVSPVKEVPIRGWLDYGFPVVKS